MSPDFDSETNFISAKLSQSTGKTRDQLLLRWLHSVVEVEFLLLSGVTSV